MFEKKASIVRVLTANRAIAGLGFLVDQQHVLTCAHVVEVALGGKQLSSPPKGKLLLDLPFMVSSPALSAQVLVWRPLRDQATTPEERGDIAVLRLLAPPTGQPARLIETAQFWGHTCRAFGHPRVVKDGNWSIGVAREEDARGWVQLEDSGENAYFIQPGFSGGPVWDEQVQGVVGMVAAAERYDPNKPNKRRLASMIPVKLLKKAWADLPVQSANAHHLAPLDKLNKHLRRVPVDFVDHMRNSEDLTTKQADRRYVELLVRERIKKQTRNTRPREGPLSQFVEPSGTRLLLFGESGAGKTTLLLKLAVDAALSASQDPQKPIPIYVRLNFFDTKVDGFDRLIEMVGNAAGLDEKEMKGIWRNAERRCLFLLDGFNEVARDFEQACISALQEFIQSKPHRYIITSRPTVQGQKLAKQVQGMKVMDMVQLDDDQMQAFLKGYGAVELYERMDDQLKGLARNPFMLRALIQSDTVSVGGELPRNSGQLYQDFIDRSMFAEREEQKAPPPTKYNYSLVKKPILAKLALMMSRERVTRRQEERRLLKLLWEWLKEFRAENEGLVEIKPYELMPDPPAAKALLDEAVHNGVLRRVENSLEFMHQSVQDYFAAVQLNILGFDNEEVRKCLDDIAQDKMDDTWDETMILRRRFK